MDVSVLEMDKQKAQKQYKVYLDAMSNKKEVVTQQHEALKKAYYHLSKGRGIIDIYEALKLAGLNPDTGHPKLAICRAHIKTCTFQAESDGHRYGDSKGRWDMRTHVKVPVDTYPTVETGRWESLRLQTPVPLIPAEHLPMGKLGNYFILWDVAKWKRIPPRDPILLRRLSKNLFVVLAEWDLTDLERAVINGTLR